MLLNRDSLLGFNNIGWKNLTSYMILSTSTIINQFFSFFLYLMNIQMQSKSYKRRLRRKAEKERKKDET